MVLALVIGINYCGEYEVNHGVMGCVGECWCITGCLVFPMLPSTGAGIIPEQTTVFNFPLDFEAGTILAFLFLLYSFDRERAWFNTSRRTYVTG